MAQTLYVIKRNDHGSGGFMSPPGHPHHFYSVEGYYGGKVKPVSGPDLIASLDYLIKDEYNDVPADVKARAQRIMDDAELTCSELWVRSAYGYFRNSYSPDGVNRNVSDAIMTGKLHCACGAETWNQRGLDRHLSQHQSGFTAWGVTLTINPGHYQVTPPLPPATHHLGYLMVRSYFPDHEPRLDLIANPGSGYGAHPCIKCRQTVQYESRHDTYCAVKTAPWSWNPDCPQGGKHEIGT